MPTLAIICVMLWLGAHIFGLLKKLLTIPVAFVKNLSCFGSVPRKRGRHILPYGRYTASNPRLPIP